MEIEEMESEHGARARTIAALVCVELWIATPLLAQGSKAALRFFGTGTNQQDRVRIPIDDDAPGPDASAPCDVGAASFTIELWLRGEFSDNATTNDGSGLSIDDARWRNGNMLIDRDVAASGRDFGLSLAGGSIEFGTGSGDGPSQERENTLEGRRNVLDGSWHHVAVVRDAALGRKSIYVDGHLDMAGPTGVSTCDLSYPDAGVVGQPDPWGPFLVIGAEKHDSGQAFPAFDGYVDELRIWSVARTEVEIAETLRRRIAPETENLVANYRFEEDYGASVADSSGSGSLSGVLVANQPGDGEWVDIETTPGVTAPLDGGSLPAGFQKTLVTGDLQAPVKLAFAPDGRLFVGQVGGRIRIVENGALLPGELMQIQASSGGGERGLLGLALDPDFAVNGGLYAYYTSLEPRNKVSRFTVTGNTAAPSSEVVIWQNAQLAAFEHHGGSIAFGTDGRLYITTGDEYQGSPSQDMSSHNGKLLCVNADGSVPTDNPFVNVPLARPEIWALGLRNPFRCTIDPSTGALWIGDVGGNGSGAWEEIERGAVGANYGWPYQEGAACYVPDCSALRAPAFAYSHVDPRFIPEIAQAAIIAGPVYRASAFPRQYHGSLFIGDYANGWIRRLDVDAHGNLGADHLFEMSPDAGPIVDMAVGPEGALYTLAVNSENGHGRLHRITYTGAGNRPPIAVASADAVHGPTPLTVQFQASASHDLDNGPSSLTFAWSFGDGASSTEVDPVHAFPTAGVYAATLLVSDGVASASAPAITIQAGNAPSVSIASPPLGALYRAGETIAFASTARDIEDGVLPASAFTWQVLLVHAAHTHPYFGPMSGASSGSFAIPVTGHGPEDTFFRIEVSVRDTDGLTASLAREIHPWVSNLHLESRPSGIPIFVDGEAHDTPLHYASNTGFQHALWAQPTFDIGGESYGFLAWSDGSTDVQRIWIAPDGGGTLKAIYEERHETTVTVSVPAADRNAEYRPSTGQVFATPCDASALCCGLDGAPIEMAFEFALPVPRGALVLAAALELTGSDDQSGAPGLRLCAYDVSSAPPFQAGLAQSLTSFAPLSAGFLRWNAPVFHGDHLYASPDLSALLQPIVSRVDWSAGNLVGLVIDASAAPAGEWRCVHNFASGTPPRLRVTYGIPPAQGQLPPRRH